MKYTVSLLRVLALVGVLALPSHIVLADEVKTNTTTTATSSIIGKVTYLLGRAELTQADGTVVPITRKTEITDGSTVSVKERSKLELLMVDGETRKLPENSTLVFNQFSYDPENPKASTVSTDIPKGTITIKTGVAGHEAPERYRLNSPLAAIAVLGTEYTVQVVGGETRVTVIQGEISMAKLAGSCQRSGLGECAGGERLSEDQRGLALVVRKDQPKPLLIPASTPLPVAKNETPPAPAAAEASKAEEEADKKSDKQETAESKNSEEKSTAQASDKASDKTADKTTEKVADKVVDKTADKTTTATVVDKTADTTAATEKSTDKTTSTKSTDERNPLAEMDAAKKTVVSSNVTTSTSTTSAKSTVVDERDPLAVAVPVVEVTVTSTPVAIVPATTSSAGNTPTTGTANNTAVTAVPEVAKNTTTSGTTLASAGNLESSSNQLSTPSTSTETATPATTPAATTTSTASNAFGLVSASGSSSTTTSGTSLLSSSSSSSLSGSSLASSTTGNTLSSSSGLESASSGVLTNALTTTTTSSSGSTSLGGVTINTDLLESSKSTSTVTTDAGQVIAAVTPPVVETPVTPVVTPTPVVDPTLPLVRWGKYNPATAVDGSTTLSDQVSSQYEQVVAAPTTGGYLIERQKGASAAVATEGDVGFTLGGYEANVNNAETGAKTAATVTDATLNVSSANKTFGTGFTLTSPVYTGAVKATGTYTNGVLTDDRTNPKTTINGAVGANGTTSGAAYTFTHQIDAVLNADGALNWTGTATGSTVAPVIPSATTGTTVGN